MRGRIAHGALAVGLLLGAWALAQDAPLNVARIVELTGHKGEWIEKEGVFRVTLPRTDISPTVAGVKLTVPMGLTCWVGFTRAGNDTLVMGDLVLLEGQVNPVLAVALENGLEVTALHNHFLWDTPRVMFMHIGGAGPEEQMARAVGKVYTAITASVAGEAMPRTAVDPTRSTLDPKKIEAILGAPGQMTGGVCKVTIGRTTVMNGHEVGSAMGVNSWAAFAGSDDEAVVDGDFVVTEAELQPTLKALRRAGINILAIHNHMTTEQPRMLFLHYWGAGTTADLAKGLKAALDAQVR